MPTLQRAGYSTVPSLTELSTWTRAQLEAVPNFQIVHATMGSVQWEGLTDVTDLNLDELVLFERNEKTHACSVEVYPLASDIPEAGAKLNKPATITVRQCWPTGYATGVAAAKSRHNTNDEEQQQRDDRLLAKYEKKLRATTERAGAEFIQYEPEQGTWSFKVQSFS